MSNVNALEELINRSRSTRRKKHRRNKNVSTGRLKCLQDKIITVTRMRLPAAEANTAQAKSKDFSGEPVAV